MGPILELENRIRESYGLVREYEAMRQVEDDPRARLDQDRQINTQWSLIQGYLDDYLNRVARLHLAVPPDIRQIAARFPALAIRAESTQIEFVNRDQELDRLDAERLRASRSPYTLIGAPAGYGKSYLLKRIVGKIEHDEAAARVWTCRYVDLGLLDDDPPAGIARALIEQPTNDVQTVVDQVIQVLAAPSTGGRRAVLLMFDSVERLDAATAQWLHELFSSLRARTWIGGREIIVVRIIVAGRTPDAFWDGYERAFPSPLAPQRIWLTPFDAYPIQELIWSQSQAVHVPLDDQIVVEIAQQVHHLSGGHPGVIRALVDGLAGQAFAVGAVDEYFRQHCARLVQAHVAPAADALLSDLPPRLRQAMQTLSVFRRVNANTVQRLVEAGELPDDTDEITLLGGLQQSHLLLGPTIQEPFYRDHLMRRVLAMALAWGTDTGAVPSAEVSPDSRVTRYARLNALALDLYSGWIGGRGLADSHLKSAQQLYSVVEWLFHALQDQAMGTDVLCQTLRAHIQTLAGETGSVADLIADQIRQDAEICYLIRQRLGDAGVQTVCDALCACQEEDNGQV